MEMLNDVLITLTHTRNRHIQFLTYISSTTGLHLTAVQKRRRREALESELNTFSKPSGS